MNVILSLSLINKTFTVYFSDTVYFHKRRGVSEIIVLKSGSDTIYDILSQCLYMYIYSYGNKSYLINHDLSIRVTERGVICETKHQTVKKDKEKG